MARNIANTQAEDAEEPVRVAVEEAQRKNDARVAQLKHEHHAACLAAYEEYAKFVTEKDEEVALLQRANADLVASSAKQATTIEHLQTSVAQKGTLLQQKDDLLKQQDNELRRQSDNDRELRQAAVDYEITIQRIPQLENDIAEKERIIRQLQDSRAQSKRAMQENIARKQDHIEALEDLLAEKEDNEQTTLKLEQVISRKSNTIQEWTKYADKLEDAARARDCEIKRLKDLVEKHKRTNLNGSERVDFSAPITEERLRALQPRGPSRRFHDFAGDHSRR